MEHSDTYESHGTSTGATTPDTTTIWDVIIIGGGLSGLAVAARLHEDTPSALFTDEEHRRYHWINRHPRQNMNIKDRKTGKVTTSGRASCCKHPVETFAGGGIKACPSSVERSSTSSTATGGPKTLVLDSSGSKWMTKWNTAFDKFSISHLRSPMFFHVDPSDRDSLLELAQRSSRTEELVELRGCVGKEISKHTRKKRVSQRHKVKQQQKATATGATKTVSIGKSPNNEPEIDERDRNDYFSPSQSLFCDHCADVIQRYGLENCIRHDEVDRISFCQTRSRFTVVTKAGKHYLSRTVVLAIGPGTHPNYPSLRSLCRHDLETTAPQVEHSMTLKAFPSPHIQSLVASSTPTTVMVVGGGLTSAQLTDLALRKGVTKVYHLVRGPSLKFKHFDVDLRWVGRYRNYAHAAFWGLDSDQERLNMIKEARGGGSVTPQYRKLMKGYEEDGRLILRTGTRVVDMKYNDLTKKWKVIVNTCAGCAGKQDGADGDENGEVEKEMVEEMDHVYFATGPTVDVGSMPCLRDMLRCCPIETCGGMPCLNQDLMWKDDVPLFVTGRLAGLRLGPGGGNLIGARTGAERIAWALGDVIAGAKGKKAEEGLEGFAGGDDDSDKGAEKQEWGYVTGMGNKFDILGLE